MAIGERDLPDDEVKAMAVAVHSKLVETFGPHRVNTFFTTDMDVGFAFVMETIKVCRKKLH